MATFGQNNEISNLNFMPTVVMGNRAIEPFYFDNPWSHHLKDKTVLIVHRFQASITCQLRRYNKLFSNPLVLPRFSPKFVRVPLANGGKTPHGSYVQTLDAVKAMIDDAAPFDVALVSAGAYAMPLAVHCKTAHRAQVVAMGGGAQILFGLKGHRWDQHEVGRRLYNPDWMYPLQEETPDTADTIEGGTYWGPRARRHWVCPVRNADVLRNSNT